MDDEEEGKGDLPTDLPAFGSGGKGGVGDYLDDAESMVAGGGGYNGGGAGDMISPSASKGFGTQFVSFSGHLPAELPSSPANGTMQTLDEDPTAELAEHDMCGNRRVVSVIRMPTVGSTVGDTETGNANGSDIGEDSFNSTRFGAFRSMFGMTTPQAQDGNLAARSLLSKQIKGTVRSVPNMRGFAARVKAQTQAMRIANEYVSEVGADEHGIKFTRRTKRSQKGVQEERAIDTKGFPFLIFHPYQPWRLLWDVCVMILLVWSFISVPIRLAFEEQTNSEECNPWFDQQEPIFYYDLSSDIIFVCDMALMFRTAYFDDLKKDGDITKERKIITDWRLIAKRYVTGFFIIDLSSSIPLDLILLSFCSGLGGAQKLLRGPSALKIMRLVRVLRLLRVTRLRMFLQKVRDVLHVHPGMLRVIRFFFIVALVMHYNACLFYYIGEADLRIADSNFTVKSWTFENDFAVPNSTAVGGYTYLTPHEMSMSSAYLVSLYWSLTTMTTVGFGDVTPTTFSGLIYSIFVLIQAGVAFSYMVGNMANLLSRVNPRHQRHQEGMEVWEEFMHREKMAPEMRQRIRNHKQYLYRYPVIKLPDFARDNMSRTLLRDVTAHLYRSALHSLPMFKGLDEHTLTELALALEPMQIAPKTIIYREGELGDCMYFISNGEVTLSMLILDAETKSELGIEIVSDVAISEHIVESRDGRTGLTRAKFQHHRSGGDELEWVGTSMPKHDSGEYKAQRNLAVFKWIMSHESPNTFFGEGCLTSRSPLRKATAVANTWCTLFRLDKAALQRVADKSPQMRKIYRKMQRTQACKLLRAVRIMIYGRRARYARAGKLIVRVEEGKNMPKMDTFMGLCDAYCTLNVGFPDPEKKTYKTMVQYNKFNPLWRETFIFPINFGLKKLEAGMPVKIHLNVLDYDVLGDHDLIGQADYEVSQLVKQALESSMPVTQAAWLSLKRPTEDGKSLTVKGFNRSRTKVRLVFQVQPPDDDHQHSTSTDPQNPTSPASRFTSISPAAGSSVPQDLMSIAAHGMTPTPSMDQQGRAANTSLKEAERSYQNALLIGKAASPVAMYIPPAAYDPAKARDFIGNNLDAPPEISSMDRVQSHGGVGGLVAGAKEGGASGAADKEVLEFAEHDDDASSVGAVKEELPTPLVRKVSKADVPQWVHNEHHNEYLQEVAEHSGCSAEALVGDAGGANSGRVPDIGAFASLCINTSASSMSRSNSGFSSMSRTFSGASSRKHSRNFDEEEEDAAFDAASINLTEKQALQMLLEASERERVKNEMELDEMWSRVEKIDAAAVRLQQLHTDVSLMAAKAISMLQGAGLVSKTANAPTANDVGKGQGGGDGSGGNVDLPGTPVRSE